MNKLAVLPLVAATALAFSTRTSEAHSKYELGRMAHELEKISRELKSEFQSHYAGSPAQSHLLKGANSLIKKAEHIDELTHARNVDYQHMASDLANIDKLANYVHKVVIDVDKASGDPASSLVHRKLSLLTDTIRLMENRTASLSKAVPNVASESKSSRYFDVTSRESQSGLGRLFSPFFGGLSRPDTTNSHAGHGHSH